MKPLFKPSFIQTVIFILGLMLLVKVIWFGIEMSLLNVDGVDHNKSASAKSLHYQSRFIPQKPGSNQVKKPISDIDSFKLLAIYHDKNHIVITLSRDGKSSVLVKGDTIDGYVLDDATATEAIFLRNGRSYRIELIDSTEKILQDTVHQNTDNKSEVSKNQAAPQGEIVDTGGSKLVDRTLLDHYRKNMGDIWQNIGIAEIKEGNTIKGFRVNFVKHGSDFSKLGLRRGDVIKSINGQELNSYQGAFDVYKNIDTMEGLTLSIEREKEVLELKYEIN